MSSSAIELPGSRVPESGAGVGIDPTIWTMLCRRDLAVARICLGSLRDALGGKVRLTVLGDASLSGDDAGAIEDIWPGARVILRAEADDRVLPQLSRRPNTARFRRENVFAIKLVDLPRLCGDAYIRYCDSDILFVSRITRLFPDSGAPLFLADDDQGYAGRLWYMKWRLGWKVPSGLNAGLLGMPGGVYDEDFVEWFLGCDEFRRVPWCTEQTCWAILARNACPLVLDPGRVLCSLKQPTQIGPSTVAIHLLSGLKAHADALAPVAGRLRNANPVVEPRFEPAGFLGTWEVLERPVQRWRRSLLESRGWVPGR